MPIRLAVHGEADEWSVQQPASFSNPSFAGLVVVAESLNPIPFRTRPLNSPAPMVLSLKTWKSRSLPGLQRTDLPLITISKPKTGSRPATAGFCVWGPFPETLSKCTGCAAPQRRPAKTAAAAPAPIALGTRHRRGPLPVPVCGPSRCHTHRTRRRREARIRRSAKARPRSGWAANPINETRDVSGKRIPPR